MCGSSYVEGCGCYQSRADFEADGERMARASEVEHEVLDLLADADAPDCSRLAQRFAALIRADPLTCDGSKVSDVLACAACIYFWLLGDGAQHCARLDANPALRLAA